MTNFDRAPRVWPTMGPLMITIFAIQHVAGLHQHLDHHEMEATLAQPHKVRHRQMMKNYKDIQYSAITVVGGQEMDGILDTGSFELLVFSKNCSSCGSTKKFYNGSRSSEHKSHPANITTMHSFGSGDTWSTLAYDEVKFGPLAIEKQYFWEVTAADLPILNAHNSFQAIVGIGPTATMKKEAWLEAGTFTAAEVVVGAFDETQAKTFSKQRDKALVMTQQKPILENLDVNVFSICFKRGHDEPGYFVWNDDDPRSDTRFTRISLVGKVHWGVKLETVEMNGGRHDSHFNIGCGGEQGCAAIVDSGTSVFAVPKAISEKTYEMLSELDDLSCDDISEFPSLEFKLGGKQFRLPPEAYIMELQGELPLGPFGWIQLPMKLCTLGFITMDVMTNEGPLWIVGMPFFREFYTTFHLGDDPWDNTNRSLFTAPSDEDCNPSTSDSGVALVQHKVPTKPKRVDLAKLAIPLWLKQAAVNGYLEL